MPMPTSSEVTLRPASPGTTQSAPRIPKAPGYPWVYTHAPGEWDVATEGLDGPTWLPVLGRRPLQPGANLVGTPKNGQPFERSYQLAKNRDEERGIVWLANSVHDYLREVDARHPVTRTEGILFLSRFNQVRILPGNRCKILTDVAEMNRWRLSLVQQGYLAPPDPIEVQPRIDEMRRRLDERNSMTGVDDSTKDREVNRHRARFEQYRDAVIPGLVEAAPPSKRNPRRKASV